MMIPKRNSSRAVSFAASRGPWLPPRPRLRFQSTSSSAPSSSPSGGRAFPFAVGIAGGLVGTGLAYTVYSFTPAGRAASNLNKAVAEANKQYEAAAKKLQNATPDADNAIASIKEFAYTYVAWIPGGRGYVDAAFQDLDTVRKNHKEEADEVVHDTYKQIQEISKSGLSFKTMSSIYDVLADLARKIAHLSVEALSDVLDNHPEAKQYLGGSLDQLKDMGSNLGPEAKKQVDETWNQLKDLLAGGLTASNLQKARKLVEEKVEQLQRLGDEAWNNSLKEMKPYLDKSPEIKRIVEENGDKLKLGNAKELFDKVREVSDSGKIDELKKYVQAAVDKAKQKTAGARQAWGSGEGWVELLPQGGSEVVSRLRELAQVADKHSDEGRQLLQETVEDLKQVLEKKSQRAKEILDQAENDAKDGQRNPRKGNNN